MMAGAKLPWAAAWLVVLMTSAGPRTVWAQPQALSPLLTAEGEGPALPWRFRGLPDSAIPRTRFVAASVEGQRALQVITHASYGTVVHETRGPAGTLQWRWRIDTPLSGGHTAPNLRTKAGDDAALKVCVMFDHALENVPLVERTLLRMARSVSGDPLPAATLCYVWDTAGTERQQGSNPYTRRVRYRVLQTATTALGQWVAESRDIPQDFIALFGDELGADPATGARRLPSVTAVVVGADGDNTASHGVGWVDALRWRDSPPSPGR